MPETNDQALIREYADSHSEPAFAALVHRHIHLVYSVAYRCVGNSQDAQDVTQAVFVMLAKKAAGLRQRTTLTGWLYETTRFIAAAFLRGQIRQRVREQKAYMQSTLNDSDASGIWQQLAPVLEEAMGRLNQKERAILAIRLFDNKTAAETAALLGIREGAAHKRTARALEKLRRFFLQRGIDSSTALIAEAISVNSIQAAPIALAEPVIAAAMVKGSLAGGSILALVKQALKTMTWTKSKLVIGTGLVMLFVVAAITIALSSNKADNQLDPAAVAILNKVFEKYGSLTNYSDTGVSVVEEPTGQKRTNTFSIQLGRPGLYRIVWKRPLKDTFDGAIWSSGAGDFEFLTYQFPNYSIPPEQSYRRYKNLESALESPTANLSGGAAWTIPPLFFGHHDGDGTGLLGQSSNFQKQRNEKISGIDCYVLTGHLKVTRDLPVTLWIGKNDFLIHQSRRTAWVGGRAVPISPTATPDEISAAKKEVLLLNTNIKRRISTRTETHENITMNQPSSKEDFIYDVPKGLKLQE